MGEEYGVFCSEDSKTFGLYFKNTAAYKAALKNRILLFHFGKKDTDKIGHLMWKRFPQLSQLLRQDLLT